MSYGKSPDIITKHEFCTGISIMVTLHVVFTNAQNNFCTDLPLNGVLPFMTKSFLSPELQQLVLVFISI